MAGARSLLGLVSRLPDTAFKADEPVSALSTLLLRNNVQHLTDMAHQYRINWCASTGAEYTSAGAKSLTYAYLVPTTITTRQTLPSYDLRVGIRLLGATTAGTAIATLRTVESNTPIVTKSWAISSAGAAWNDHTQDVDVSWASIPASGISYRDSSTGTTAVRKAPRSHILLLLEITTVATGTVGGSDGMHLCGVQLREYLS